VFEFISRRLIVPSAALDNTSYRDLATYTPGTIPVLEVPLSEELVQAVTVGGTHQFPVFIEVDDTVDPGLAPIISWAKVRCLHFASEDNLVEHRARAGGIINVPNFEHLKVTPHCFTGGSLTLAELETKADRQTDKRVQSIFWSDRWSGAVLAASYALRDHGSAEAAEAMAQLFTDSGTASGMSFLPALRHMRAGRAPGKGKGEDQQLFAAIIHLIHGGLPVDNGGFVEQLIGDPELAESTVVKLRNVADFLDNRADFETFKEASNPAIRGLFIALNRRNLGTLAEWALKEANAQLEAVISAAAIHGIAVGRHNLPTDQRPEELDQYLASLEQEAVLKKGANVEPAVTREINADGTQSHKVSLEEASITLNEPPTPLVELVRSANLSTDQIKDMCIDLIESEGWGQLALRTRLGAPEFQYVDGQVVIPGLPVFEYEVLTDEFVKLLSQSEPHSDSASKLRRALTESTAPVSHDD
jgi:hypothetical protein